MSKRTSTAKEPAAMEEDLQMLMDGIINEEYVRQETGKEDLTTIQHLSLVIDTSRQSVYDLHVFLPNLQHLVLDNSTITSVRDLGIGLRFLTSLSLSNCSLIDIDGIGVLTGLQDLCLSDNELTDVTPLAMHENLQNLNLSGNRITDISVADSLSSCLALKSLFLSRNPLCKARNYRLIIASIISGLKMLDGKPVDPDAAKKVNNGMILESAAELRVNEEDLDDEMRLENEILECKPAAADGIPDTGSELTHGSAVVLAGNVAAAVRRRRNASEASQGSQAAAADKAEYESTLDILDAAIGRSDSRTSSRPGSNQAKSGPMEESAHGASFYREGDITSSHAGAAARFAERASLRLNTTGEDCGYPGDGSASPQVSSRSNYGRNRNGSGEFAPKDAPSPAPRSSSQWSSGRRGDTDVSMSFDIDTSLVGGQNLRPKTSGGVSSSGSFKLAAPSPTMRAASPLQRNSSRPQSAASVGSNSPQLGRSASTQAAPFKVAVDKTSAIGVLDDVTTSPSALTFPAIRGSSKGSSIVHLDIVKRPTGSYMIAEDDEEGVGGVHPHSTNAQGDDDSDTEDIAVTHAARHRLMFASSSAASANSVTSNLKARQQILQRLKSTSSKDSDTNSTEAERCKTPPTAASRGSFGSTAPGVTQASPRLEMGIAERGSARKSSRTAECVLESLENSPQRPPNAAAKGKTSASKDTLSSKAGMSLGFHLAGSLAAIDKWVQDMNSEDEGGDEEEDDDDSVAAPTGKLITSLALPDKHSDHDATGVPPSGLEGNSKDSCSDFSSASKNSRSKILSRDTILSMCSNSGRGASRGSQDMEEDSDLDEPDLEVYRQAQLEEPRRADARAAGTAESASSRGAKKDSSSAAYAQSTAGSRSRNADVLNRVNGARNTSRPRPAAAEDADAAARKAKPRAVPDFPPMQAAASRAQNEGPVVLEEAGPGADTVSPPRHTAPAIAAPRQKVGAASAMSDEELVELLKQKPKNTLVLRTTSNFQEFFSGITAKRMQDLLRKAYADIADASERKEKIDKRMKLLENVLS